MLSGARRLTASTVILVISPLVRSRKSYVTDNPRNPHRADTGMTIPVRIRKITAGSGSLFPTRPRYPRLLGPCFFCPSFAKTIPPIMCILCPAKFFCGHILYPVYHSLLYRLILHSHINYGASIKTAAEAFVILTVTFASLLYLLVYSTTKSTAFCVPLYTLDKKLKIFPSCRHCFKQLCALKYKHTGHGNVKRNVSTGIAAQERKKKGKEKGKQWREEKGLSLTTLNSNR